MERLQVVRLLMAAAVAAGSAFAGVSPTSPVPEPATVMMMGGGVGALLLLRHAVGKSKRK